MLSYELDGKGPPLVLIHGFGISFNIWRGLQPLLRDHFTLILTEMPGIGCSPPPPSSAPYLDSAVDGLDSLRASLGFERWSVLGYSSGSRVAERYVQCHPERVERAVFLSPAQTAAYKALGLRVAIRLDACYPQVGNWVLSGWRIRFLIDLLGFNLKANTLGRAWFEEITSQPMGILKETLRSMPDGGGRPFAVPALPTLFVWGSQDLIADCPFRLSARDRLIRANHSAPQTDVAEIVEVVLPFLKSNCGADW